jgi:ribosomal protein L37AE/L43A
MDLFDCPCCESRFVVENAGDGGGWTCPRCGSELHLVVRRLPGSPQAVAAALDATIINELPGA